MNFSVKEEDRDVAKPWHGDDLDELDRFALYSISSADDKDTASARPTEYSSAGESTPEMDELDSLAMGIIGEPKQSSKLSRIAKLVPDAGLAFAKGLAKIPDATAGLVDLATRNQQLQISWLATGKARTGYFGKLQKYAMDAVGLNIDVAADFYDSAMSDEQKAATKQVDDATGFVDTAMAYIENPSVALMQAAESLPLMAATWGVTGAAMKSSAIASSFAPGTIAAAAEGALSAGSIQEEMRRGSEEGLTTAKQSGMAALAGVGVAAVGAASNKLGVRLGIEDIEVPTARKAMLEKAVKEQAKRLPYAVRLAAATLKEGVVEEGGQTFVEATATNIGEGKPVMEGVGKQVVGGIAAGGVMGAMANIKPQADANAKADAAIRSTLEDFGADAQDIDALSAEDRKRVQAALIAGLNAEQGHKLIKTNQGIELFDKLAERWGYNFKGAQEGISPNFNPPMIEGPDGKPVPNWTSFGGDGRSIEDAESGIAITQDGKGEITVWNRKANQAVPAESEQEAVELARNMSVYNQVVDRSREKKLGFLSDAAARLAGKVEFQAFNTFDELMAAHGKEVKRDRKNTAGVKLADGTVAVVLDNIGSPYQMLKTVLHEAGVHIGIREVFQDKAARDEFLGKIDKREIAPALELVKKKGYDPNSVAGIEEALAYMYEKRTANPTTYQRGVAALHDQFRKLFPKMRFSRSDIEVIMSRAQRQVRGEGGLVENRGGEAPQNAPEAGAAQPGTEQGPQGENAQGETLEGPQAAPANVVTPSEDGKSQKVTLVPEGVAGRGEAVAAQGNEGTHKDKLSEWIDANDDTVMKLSRKESLSNEDLNDAGLPSMSNSERSEFLTRIKDAAEKRRMRRAEVGKKIAVKSEASHEAASIVPKNAMNLPEADNYNEGHVEELPDGSQVKVGVTKNGRKRWLVTRGRSWTVDYGKTYHSGWSVGDVVDIESIVNSGNNIENGALNPSSNPLKSTGNVKIVGITRRGIYLVETAVSPEVPQTVAPTEQVATTPTAEPEQAIAPVEQPAPAVPDAPEVVVPGAPSPTPVTPEPPARPVKPAASKAKPTTPKAEPAPAPQVKRERTKIKVVANPMSITAENVNDYSNPALKRAVKTLKQWRVDESRKLNAVKVKQLDGILKVTQDAIERKGKRSMAQQGAWQSVVREATRGSLRDYLDTLGEQGSPILSRLSEGPEFYMPADIGEVLMDDGTYNTRHGAGFDQLQYLNDEQKALLFKPNRPARSLGGMDAIQEFWSKLDKDASFVYGDRQTDLQSFFDQFQNEYDAFKSWQAEQRDIAKKIRGAENPRQAERVKQYREMVNMGARKTAEEFLEIDEYNEAAESEWQDVPQEAFDNVFDAIAKEAMLQQIEEDFADLASFPEEVGDTVTLAGVEFTVVSVQADGTMAFSNEDGTIVVRQSIEAGGFEYVNRDQGEARQDVVRARESGRRDAQGRAGEAGQADAGEAGAAAAGGTAAAQAAEPEALTLSSLTAAELTAQKEAEAVRAEEKRVADEKADYIRRRQAEPLGDGGKGALDMDQDALPGIATDTPLFDKSWGKQAAQSGGDRALYIEEAYQDEAGKWQRRYKQVKGTPINTESGLDIFSYIDPSFRGMVRFIYTPSGEEVTGQYTSYVNKIGAKKVIDAFIRKDSLWSALARKLADTGSAQTYREKNHGLVPGYVAPNTLFDKSWGKPAAQEQPATPAAERVAVVGIGDLHGESPDKLDASLERDGVLQDGKWATDKTVVQVGDVTDRGKHTNALIRRMRALQRQSGNKLVRIIGNHDFFHIFGQAEQVRGKSDAATTAMLREDVLAGRVVAAWAEGDTLYTHAGLDLSVFPEYEGMPIQDIVADLNRRLVDAVRGGDIESDPLFGNKGIIWTRGKIENPQFRQVVGHTPAKDGKHSYKDGDRVKYIDTGRVFGGDDAAFFNTVANIDAMGGKKPAQAKKPAQQTKHPGFVLVASGVAPSDFEDVHRRYVDRRNMAKGGGEGTTIRRQNVVSGDDSWMKYQNVGAGAIIFDSPNLFVPAEDVETWREVAMGMGRGDLVAEAAAVADKPAVAPVAEKAKRHHKVYYNGKTLEVTADEKVAEFRKAAMRVRNNLKAGEVGYVETPAGKFYEISLDSKMAKPVKMPDGLDKYVEQPAQAAQTQSQTAQQPGGQDDDVRFREADGAGDRLTNLDGTTTITYQQGNDSNATDTQNRQVRAQRLPQGVDGKTGKDHGGKYADVLRRGVSEHADWYADFEQGKIDKEELKFREGRLLAQEAERNDDILPSDEFDRRHSDLVKNVGERNAGGGENVNALEVVDGKRYVVKRNNVSYSNSYLDFFNKIALHNHLFPDTAYEFVGFMYDKAVDRSKPGADAALQPVLRQRFVVRDGVATKEEVRAAMEAIGFRDERNGQFVDDERGIVVLDLENGNVLVDKAGDVAVIDPVIETTERFWQGDTMFREAGDGMADTLERDAAYLAVVEAGDDATAQKMVDKARTGTPYTTPKLYHGTPNFGFTTFGEGNIFASESSERAGEYTGRSGVFAGVREIRKTYATDDGIAETLLKNAKAYFGSDAHFVTQAERKNVLDKVDRDSESMSNKVDSEWTSEAASALANVKNSESFSANGFDFESAVAMFLSFPRTINDVLRENRAEDGIARLPKYISNVVQDFNLVKEPLRQFLADNFESVRGTAAEGLVDNIILGYGVTDLAIEAETNVLSALENDTVVADGGGSFVRADAVRRVIDQVRDVGAYQLYGNPGNNPLVIDAKGGYWTVLPVPQWGGRFDTGTIAKRAKSEGYTSVNVKNVIDPGKGGFSENVTQNLWIFFNKNDVKSADPVTRDDAGRVIPLSERFNEKDDDVRYRISDQSLDDSGLGPDDTDIIRTTKAYIDARRRAIQLDPLLESEALHERDAYQAAQTTLALDPNYAQHIIASIVKSPRAVTPEERMMLLIQNASVEYDYSQAIEAGEAAKNRGDDLALADAINRKEQATKALEQIDRAIRYAGRESGRSLRFIQASLNKDGSLATMRRRMLAAQNFEPLTEAQEAFIQKKFKALEEVNRKLREHIQELEGKDSHDAAKRGLNKLLLDRKPIDPADKLARAIDVARKLAAQNDGALDEVDIAAFIRKIAKLHVAMGARTVEDLTERIQGSLREVIPQREFSQRFIQDAISQYGKVTYPNPEQDAKTLRDLRQQMMKLSAIEDVLNELAPLKTGPQRDEPSAEVRELTKRLHQLMKEMGINAGDRASQLKSSHDSIKTRLKNQIEDIERAIANGEPMPEDTHTSVAYDDEDKSLKERRDALKKQHDDMFSVGNSDAAKLQRAIDAAENTLAKWQKIVDDATQGKFKGKNDKPVVPPEVQAIQEKINALKKEHQHLLDLQNPKLSAEEIAMRNYKRGLERSIAKQQEKLDTKNFGPQPKNPPRQLDKETFELQQKRDAIKAQVDKEEQRWRLAHRALHTKVIDLLAAPTNWFRALASSFDDSAFMRQGGLVLAAHPKIAFRALRKSFKTIGKIHGFGVGEGGEFEAAKIQDEIQGRRNFEKYNIADLYLPSIDADSTLSDAEEDYKLRFYNLFGADDAPKYGGVVGKAHKVGTKALRTVNQGIRASERLYVSMLNLMRADMFDAMAATSPKGSADLMTDEELKAIGNFINIATGRGKYTEKLTRASNALSTALWSPRNLMARFQFIIGQPFMSGDAMTRKMIAKEYAKMAFGQFVKLAALSMLALGGDDDDDDTPIIETDPRSSDFGKIRIGDTRIDPGSGLNQAFVYSMRMLTNRTKTGRGDLVEIRGKNAGYGQSAQDITERFIRSKLSPTTGIIADMWYGTTYEGTPIAYFRKPEEGEVSALSRAAQLPIPLSIRDVLDVGKEHGIAKGAVLTTLSMLGAGVQVYDNRNYQTAASEFRHYVKAYNAAETSKDRQKVLASAPYLRKKDAINATIRDIKRLEDGVEKLKKNNANYDRAEEAIANKKKLLMNMVFGLDD